MKPDIRASIRKTKGYRRTIRTLLRETYAMFRSCLGKVTAFALLFSAANMMITPTLIRLLIRLALAANGTTYIAPDNLAKVLLSPVSLLLAVPMLIVIIIPPIIEVAALIHAFSLSKLGKEVTLSGMLRAGLDAVKRSVHPRNWLIVLFFAVMLPLTGMMDFASGAITVAVPEFISDFIAANVLYDKLAKGLYLVLLFAELSVVFMLNFYVLEEKNLFAACRESRRLIKGRRMLTVAWIAANTVLFFLFSVAMSAVVSEVVVRLGALLSTGSGSITRAESVKSITELVRNLLTGIILPVVNVAAVTTLFYEFVEEDQQLIRMPQRAFRNGGITKIEAIALSIIVVVLCGVRIYTGGFVTVDTAAPEVPAIVAHRGDSIHAPENTMPAFELGALLRPEWVEFDVHETKDGVIIVSHDDDLSRVSGQSISVHELTYAQTQELEVGSWFSEDYRGTGLSTLDEVLKFFKPYDFDLQIEIKPTGYDPDLQEKVIEVIRQNDMTDRCLITCLQLEPLLRMKEVAPEIRVVYSMFVAWGNIEDIPVDGYTIEEGNVTRELVQNVHKAGKPVYAWTANTEETIQHLYDCGVDGILTDDPAMLRNALSLLRTSRGPLRDVRLFVEELIRGH